MDVHIGRLFQISKLKSSTALSFLPVRSGRCTPTPPRRAAVADPASPKKKTRNVADVSRPVGDILPTVTAGVCSEAGSASSTPAPDLPTERTLGKCVQISSTT